MKEWNVLSSNEELSPRYDPWDPLRSLSRYGKHVLTSVEMTVTHLCNMRCEHCAVGDSLLMSEGEMLPLHLMLKRLDEVEHLETISITGGEPAFRLNTVRKTIIPLLRYAKDRGIRSQLNSNITLDLGRYEEIAADLDVLHISYNYLDAADFHQVGFARAGRPAGSDTSMKLFERMVENARALSSGGLFVSAESMINFRTYNKLPEIHRLIVEMGCRRHEVHPMYPSAFASELPLITLDQLRSAIHGLLDVRDPDIWMLFGTLPFFGCNELVEDRRLLERLRQERNVTVRNDPDGRNRLNINMFTGDIYVTDFADFPALGNISQDQLDDVFSRWLEASMGRSVNCYCPQAACCGPNLLVAHSYYQGVDFTKRSAIV